MTKGQIYAIKILVANDLGINIGYVDHAKNLYENGVDIPDNLGFYFADEARIAANRIVEAGLKECAQVLFNEYKKKLA